MARDKGPAESDTSIKTIKNDDAPPGSERCSIEVDPRDRADATPVNGTDEPHDGAATAAGSVEPPYTVLSERKKKFLLMVASFAAPISPFSTPPFYPSVVTLARDLRVSVSRINLTISTYQIFQGVAPTFTAALADVYGRRPAFLLCFVVYFGANLGLALQNSYAALLVLRCVQSSGSSGTNALAQAVVADIATRAERGKYLGYAIIGATVGPAMGPVVGGLLTQFLGWRSMFWFLLILGSVIFVVVFSVFPETARSIVGDGSIPAPRWNRSLFEMLSKEDPERQPPPANLQSLEPRLAHANPLTSLIILWDRENSILCFAGGLLYAGYTAVTSVFASQLEERFHYNAVQTGLCYLPIAFGSLLSALTTARLIDWNFQRQAKKQGLAIVKNRQQDITEFDTEKARLAFAFPMILLSSGLLIAYGWEMEYHAPLAVILVTMFFLANLLTGSLVSNLALLTDLNRTNAAAVGAAVNLTRCLLSAGGVAIVGPVIGAVGIGWMATITAGIWVLVLLGFALVYQRGFTWRQTATAKQRRAEEGNGGDRDHDESDHDDEEDQDEEDPKEDDREEGEPEEPERGESVEGSRVAPEHDASEEQRRD